MSNTAWYPEKPEELTYMALPDGKADVWVRQDIEEVGTEYASMTKAQLEAWANDNGVDVSECSSKAEILAVVEGAAGRGWQCEEVYFRTTLSEDEVTENADELFANGGPAIDEEGTESVSEPTLSERLEAVEATIAEQDERLEAVKAALEALGEETEETDESTDETASDETAETAE